MRKRLIAGLLAFTIAFTAMDFSGFGGIMADAAGLVQITEENQGNFTLNGNYRGYYTIADKEVGIILLTEKFGREFPEIIDDVRLHHKTPLIIEIPDRHGTGRKPDFITSYVNEAIGLKL